MKKPLPIRIDRTYHYSMTIEEPDDGQATIRLVKVMPDLIEPKKAYYNVMIIEMKGAQVFEKSFIWRWLAGESFEFFTSDPKTLNQVPALGDDLDMCVSTFNAFAEEDEISETEWWNCFFEAGGRITSDTIVMSLLGPFLKKTQAAH